MLVPTELEARRLALRHAPLELCGFGLARAGVGAMHAIARHRPQRVVLAGVAGSYDAELAPIGAVLAPALVRCHGIGVGDQTPAQLGFADSDEAALDGRGRAGAIGGTRIGVARPGPLAPHGGAEGGARGDGGIRGCLGGNGGGDPVHDAAGGIEHGRRPRSRPAGRLIRRWMRCASGWIACWHREAARRHLPLPQRHVRLSRDPGAPHRHARVRAGRGAAGRAAAERRAVRRPLRRRQGQLPRRPAALRPVRGAGQRRGAGVRRRPAAGFGRAGDRRRHRSRGCYARARPPPRRCSTTACTPTRARSPRPSSPTSGPRCCVATPTSACSSTRAGSPTSATA